MFVSKAAAFMSESLLRVGSLFVPSKVYKACLMFVSKAGAHRSESLLRLG
jgi:hypothetical protein